MKKYAIVYADGSNRRLTQTDYPSRKEAGDALIYFLTCNNASYSKAVLRAQGSWVNDFDKDRITQRLSKGLIHAYTQRRFAPYDGFQTEPFSISHVSAYIPRGTKFFVSDDHQTIGAEELYILNHMAPRAFGLTDQQVYDIIALAIWNRKNQ